MATSTNRRAHLGVGWAFPVRPMRGSLRYARYEEDIEQAIGIILETAQRERVMLPEFGAGLQDQVFAPNSPALHRSLELLVEQALLAWEPRVTVERVAARDGDGPNVALIEIDYVVRRTNAAFNRVFPFYLAEGV